MIEHFMVLLNIIGITWCKGIFLQECVRCTSKLHEMLVTYYSRDPGILVSNSAHVFIFEWV